MQYALSNANGVIIREAGGAPITYLHNDIVYMDGNHPLAGQSLHFEVEIRGIRDATEDEIRSGKALPD